MRSKLKPSIDRSQSEPGAFSALAFLAALLGMCGVFAYAFLSTSYLGPILAAVCGVAIMISGAVFGARGRGEPGTTPAAVSIMLAGMALMFVGGATALIHLLRTHI